MKEQPTSFEISCSLVTQNYCSILIFVSPVQEFPNFKDSDFPGMLRNEHSEQRNEKAGAKFILLFLPLLNYAVQLFSKEKS